MYFMPSTFVFSDVSRLYWLFWMRVLRVTNILGKYGRLSCYAESNVKKIGVSAFTLVVKWFGLIIFEDPIKFGNRNE
jgi:hypothetical protein